MMEDGFEESHRLDYKCPRRLLDDSLRTCAPEFSGAHVVYFLNISRASIAFSAAQGALALA